MRRAIFASAGGLLVLAGVTGLPTALAAPAPTPANLTVNWIETNDATDIGCTTTCTSSPTGGPGASMAYDPATHQLILFGVDQTNSTWSWDGGSWTQVDDSTDPGCTTTCTDSPPERNTFGMTYDADSRSLLVFGGNDLNDTWSWNGTTWTQVADAGDAGCTSACTDSPPASYGDTMAYDAATHQVVLFGGSNISSNFNDTWVLTYQGGTFTWTQVDDAGDAGCTTNCTNSPPARNVTSLTWDPATSQLVMFGGELTAGSANGLSDTWLWNGHSWSQVDDHDGALAGCGESMPTSDRCPSSPNGRVGMGVAYDPEIGRLVLLGGMNHYNNPEYNDTWVWNGRAWLQIDDPGSDAHCTTSCTNGPPARDVFAFADDSETEQLVVFGGNPNFNDTWVANAIPSPPSPPTHLHVTTSGGNVTVWWSAPTQAGPPITMYRATASPGGHACVTGRIMHCTIRGLSVHDHYSVTVTATSLNGTGSPAVLHNVRG